MLNATAPVSGGEDADWRRQLGSIPWHAEGVEVALSAFEARCEGLTQADVQRRLELYGYNWMPEGERRSALIRFLSQFNNVLIYVLLAAAGATAILGHGIDTAVILLVVLVNAVIGFIQEGRAERALEAIRAMISTQASVIRDGQRRTIRAEELVPGEIVLLEAGDRVPADLRLIRGRSLRIDEAILTGESVPVEKATSPVAPDSALGDRTCMAFSGSLVVAGQGMGVVVGTGAGTEIGRITTLLGEVERLTTPLIRQMNQFARVLTGVILAAAAAVFGISVSVHETPWGEAFMAVVGLAVAAIPEGLPAVMTITLAIGVQRMAARNAIIRHLPAVETLGSVSVICSDKTGTLTRNEMMAQTIVTLERRFEITGSGYAPEGDIFLNGIAVETSDEPVLTEVVRGACLCNDAGLRTTETGWAVDGDPMEGALVSLAMKAGMDPPELRAQFSRVDEIPFDAQHRFMASLHRLPDGGAVLYVKGAPERVIAMCEKEYTPAGERPVDTGWWTDRQRQPEQHGSYDCERFIVVTSLATSIYSLVSSLQSHDVTLPPPPLWLDGTPLVGKKLTEIWALVATNLPAALTQYGHLVRGPLTWLGSFAGGLALGELAFVLSFAIAAVLVVYGKSATEFARRLLERVTGSKARAVRLVTLTAATIRGVALGVVGVALIQSLLLGVGFFAIGLQAAGALTLVALVLGIMQVPLILLTLPVVGYVFATEATPSAIMFLIWNVIVGLSDNVLRPLMLGRGLEVPMPVILVGVMGGMIVDGLLGLFVGPVLLAVTYVLLLEWVRQHPVDGGPQVGGPAS